MTEQQLTIKVNSIEESLARFKEVWEKSEQGKKIKTPVEILSFENSALLLKTLTSKRLELLQGLHELGKSSIRNLAKRLNRDYSNVYQDIKVLHRIDLVCQDEAGNYSVPWSKIITEISMTAPPRQEESTSLSVRLAHR